MNDKQIVVIICDHYWSVYLLYEDCSFVECKRNAGRLATGSVVVEYGICRAYVPCKRYHMF